MARESLGILCSKIKEIEVLESFSNALEALDFIKQNKIDLILLDVEMPDFTGMDLIKVWEESPQVIFTTGKKDYAVDAFEFQATDFITKPVRLPRLMKAVDRALQLNASTSKTTDDEYDEIFNKSGWEICEVGDNGCPFMLKQWEIMLLSIQWTTRST